MAEWRGDRMGLESLGNLGPSLMANTLNHLILSCRALCDLWHSGCGLVDGKAQGEDKNKPNPSCHKSSKALRANIK